jgi:hypothetical protein
MTDPQRTGRAPTPTPPTELDRQALGVRLKEAREYLELSQDEVASVRWSCRSSLRFISAPSAISPAKIRIQPCCPKRFNISRVPRRS